MITGTIKNKIDAIWTGVWTGGITNPLTVIEQLTYLMFIRSLDVKEMQTEWLENAMGFTGDHIFPKSAVGRRCGGAISRTGAQRISFTLSATSLFLPSNT